MTKRPIRFTFAWALLTLLVPAPPAAAKVIERIIARVNNEIITQHTYNEELRKLRMQLAQEHGGADIEERYRQLSQDTLRDLIDQALLVQKAKDLEIDVETDVVRRLDDVRKQYNLATLEDLQREVEKAGLLFEDFKDQIRRSLQVREVISNDIGRSIVVTREDARKYYEAHREDFRSPGGVRLGEVLISTEKRTPEEASARAKEALAELKAGAKFSETVKKYSDAPSAKDQGDLGFIKAGTPLTPALAAVLDKLEVNEFSEPIQTKYGYAIFKVLERISPGIPRFEEVEQRVEGFLYNERVQPAMREYLIQLRKDSYLTIAPGYVDTGAPKPTDAALAKKKR